MVPWVTRRTDPIMATGYHMLLGGAPLLALSAAREAPLLAERLPQLTGAAKPVLGRPSASAPALASLALPPPLAHRGTL